MGSRVIKFARLLLFWMAHMQKNINSLIKWLGKYFFVTTIGVFFYIYIKGFQIAPFRFVSSDPALSHGAILLAIYSLIVIFLTITNNRTCSTTFLVFAAILFFCFLSLYVNYFKPNVVSHTTCNGTTYYLTLHPNSPTTVDWYHYRLTKWRGLSEYDSDFFAFSATYLNKIVCDEKTKQVRTFNTSGHLYHADDGEQGFYYDWNFSTTVNNLKYDLYSYDKNHIRRYVFTVCSPEKVDSCQIIPVDHSSPEDQDEKGSVIADMVTNDVYFLFDGKIFFTYGDETRKFNHLASNEQYNIASYQKNASFAYVLYECENYECYCIPFSYSTTESKDVKLKIDDIDEKTKELSVYIGSDLVFTYKVIHDESKCRWGCPESQCLVEGCTIPGQ